MRPCVVVPHFNHERQIPAVLAGLALLGLPVLVIDDGSSPESLALLEQMAGKLPWVELHPGPGNRGKGAAVMRGLRLARDRGFSHIVQIDADGQHRIADIPAMLAVARENPDALVSGRPVYDQSVPGTRLHGRKISIFWTSVETWSMDIKDPMCGFRVYPVVRVLEAVAGLEPGVGMEFDLEILVRAHWARIPLIFMSTPVIYPDGGVSHFRMFRDNVRISAMHTRLFFGMLRRSPAFLARRLGKRA